MIWTTAGTRPYATRREAIVEAIRTERAGFHVGDRLTTLELARHNAIHRNTLINVMNDLVREGFVRRRPNKGFEIVHPAPERPSLLTRHILSLTDVARRSHVDARSEMIAEECGIRKARELMGPLVRVKNDLLLAAGDTVSVLARCRLMKSRRARQWGMVAITYCSQGPVELTRTWFDSSRAVLLASSLEVKLT